MFLREPTESIGAQAHRAPGITRKEREREKGGEEEEGPLGDGNREGESGTVDRPASTLNPSRIRIQCSHHDDSRDTASVRASPAVHSSSSLRDPIDPRVTIKEATIKSLDVKTDRHGGKIIKKFVSNIHRYIYHVDLKKRESSLSDRSTYVIATAGSLQD